MISIRYLDDNRILVKYLNGDFNTYINTIFKHLIKYAKPNFAPGGGWIFQYKYLEKIKEYFTDIKYLNEYKEPAYSMMGDGLKLKPYDYQKEAIYSAINSKDILLVLPCGAGKTPICIGVYYEALKANLIKGPGLIVVKASLKSQWKNEINKFSNFSANILKTYSDRCSNYLSKIKRLNNKIKKEKDKDIILELEKEMKDIKEKCDEHFYEQFNNFDLLISNYETLNDQKVLSKLIDMNIECVLCDEIHYVKTHTASRSKALYKLSNAKIKVGATATPITKDPRDIYGVFSFVCPDILGSYNNFQRSFIKFAGYGRINGFKNMDKLRSLISNNVFIKTKEEISGQLPQVNVSQVYIDLTSEQLAMHKNIMEELDSLNDEDYKIRSQCHSEREAMLNEELQKISGKVMALQTFAQELTDSPKLLSTSESDYSRSHAEGLDPNCNPKLDTCLELIDQIVLSGEKVCIFSKFERMQSILTDAINNKYKKNHIGIAYVNGSLSSQQRYVETYDKFRDNDNYKILLCSDAGAAGLNLSKCKYIIEYDLADSYATQTQRQGRIERADSIHDNVFVFQLVGNDSWDIIQQRIINKKEDFDSSIIKSLSK